MTAVLLGDKELDRNLRKLGEKSSKKAIVAGIRASMRPIATAMRRAINQAIADPELKAEARKTIGARFARKYKSDLREAKVGFGVGKKRAKQKATGQGQSAGVGLTSRTVHWFVLGTKERRLKKPHTAAFIDDEGKLIFRRVLSTGKVAAVFADVTRNVVASTGEKSLAAARKKIKQVIEREARKRG